MDSRLRGNDNKKGNSLPENAALNIYCDFHPCINAPEAH